MAKNKNRERKQPKSERGRQQTQQSTTTLEPPAEHRAPQVTPGDMAMARKDRHKRFGHN
ncbi:MULTISPECIES: hypothetical protein [Streptomyces]|jgi:hypothetical protein|uniref:hypothetical protein n=1 Tax=Streptomyces TaxID=1883 RepID=UPI001785ADF7|nr:MULTISPECIES: hypothetical protein [Streptomyces]